MAIRFTRWDQTLTTEDTNTVCRELALRHLAEVSNPASPAHGVANTVREMIRDGRLRELCEFAFPYDFAMEPLEVYHIRQALAFFQKRGDLDVGIDREAVAWEKFCSTEAKCRETNQVFQAWSRGEFFFLPDVEEVFHLMQRKIANVLGPVPSFADLKFRFGPGATTNVKRKIASPRNKLAAAFACSEDLIPAVQYVLEEMPGWVFGSDDPNIATATVTVEIHHGRLSFVLKNALTYRSVVTEPPLNGICQNAVGDYMVPVLRVSGLDLKNQERNQALARMGSITGALATLDLSSASDLNATEAGWHFLPYDWASLLARFRTGKVTYRGKEIKLQKFSTMGNGYTFPLESLIFWALASCATEVASGESRRWVADNVGVYGDDIIVPVCAVDLVVKCLTALGHSVNKAKSFTTGPFRESCGKDYFRGIDVRPCFIKEQLMGCDVFKLHNYYVRSLQPEFAAHVLNHIAEPLRIWGPDGYGDGHLIGDDPDKFLRPHRRSIPRDKKVPGGWGGWTFDTYAWNPKLDFRVTPGDRVLPCYSIYATHPYETPVEELKRENLWLRYGYDAGALTRAIRDGLLTREITETSPPKHRGKLLGTPIPGSQGYRRIKIYTLNPDG